MQTQEKSRIHAVNIVYLISILITVVVAFLPLDFLVGRPGLQLIFSQVILALPSVLYLLKYRLPYAETVRFKKLKLADMAWCVLFGILIQPLLTLLNALSMVFASNTTSTFMLELSSQIPFLAALFLMAVVPAVLEESVYRGIFYNEYSRLNPWKAAILSGFLFGLMHGNLNQFCYAAVMGILFALLIEATGSILSTMLIHFWINASSVVAIYLYPKLYEVAQAFYNMYVEHGNEESARLLSQTFGDMTLSSTEWLQQLLTTSAMAEWSVWDVLALYGPSAVIMGVLAFFVYRRLAMRNGNWDRICGFFKKQQKNEGDILEASMEAVPRQKMITLPLAFAIFLGIAFMIFCEVLLHFAV